MVRIIHYALLADGTSDRALLPALEWLLRREAKEAALSRRGFTARRPSADIADEIASAIALFRPDLLFVHRDAEGMDPQQRLTEIPDGDRIVKVVPVRMTEAWLLFDAEAIRLAADRPRSRVDVDLPPLNRVESISDPKSRLRDTLLRVAEVTGRKHKRFRQDLANRVQRVAEVITDYSPLLQVPSFRHLANAITAALRQLPHS